jgi:hypothetical protein
MGFFLPKTIFTMPLRMYELRIAKYEFRTMVVGLLFLMLPVVVESQVTCLPVFPKTDDDVTITFDATQGNGALAGVSPVYAHAGVITNQSNSPSDWKYVKTTWGVPTRMAP